MKANILGTTYKIKRKTLKNSNTDGWCDNTSKTIVLEKTIITMLEILNI